MRITKQLKAVAKEMYCQFYEQNYPKAIAKADDSWTFGMSDPVRLEWYKKAQRVIDAYLRAK